jgi:NADH-quinone oxidoreductase subunit L
MLLNKYYIDEIYDTAVVEPTVKISDGILWKGVDVVIIDGTVNGSAKIISAIAQIIRKIQTGVAQTYAVVFIGGVLFVIAWLLFR